MMMPKPPSSERYEYLDGIRGLASLMVAVCHYVTAFQPDLLNGDASLSHFPGDYLLARTRWVFFYNPDFGVAVFFVLSGFVLAASVAHEPPSWPSLALRRWVRLILPVLTISIILWIALYLGAFRGVPEAAVQAKSKWFAAMFADPTYHVPLWKQIGDGLITFFRLDQSSGLSGALNPVLWTMPIELQGSLVLFAVYCYGADLFRRRRGRVLVMLLAVPLTFQTNFYGFGLGIALFEAKRLLEEVQGKWRQILLRLAVPVGVLLLISGLWLASAPYLLNGNSSYLALTTFLFTHAGLVEGVEPMHHVGAACIIAAALLLAPLRWLLTTWPCRYLGRISFMLYLVQIPLLCGVGVPVFLHTMPSWDYEHRALLALGAYLVTAVIIAELATRWIDIPSIRLSRRVTARSWGWWNIGAWLNLVIRGAGAETK
ncbi:MAG: acyltransferase [Rhodospirillales bacterium]|nr:acyltransferase [Rhodospirillales bacterium]